jgi:hypothetical protein
MLAENSEMVLSFPRLLPYDDRFDQRPAMTALIEETSSAITKGARRYSDEFSPAV